MRTNAGRSWQALIMGDGSGSHPDTSGAPGTGSYAPADYLGLTADDTPPAAEDTTLASEIGAGTLARAQAVFAHTNGTDTYTLTRTFTSDQSVELNKIGVFTASSGGVMAFEEIIDPSAPLESGDQVAFTATISL